MGFLINSCRARGEEVTFPPRRYRIASHILKRSLMNSLMRRVIGCRRARFRSRPIFFIPLYYTERIALSRVSTLGDYVDNQWLRIFTLSIVSCTRYQNGVRCFPFFFFFFFFFVFSLHDLGYLLLSFLIRVASFDSITSKLVSIHIDTRDRTRARTAFPATDADIFLRISRRGTVDFARISFVNKKQDTWLSAVEDGIYDRLHDHLSLGDNTCPYKSFLVSCRLVFVYTDES